MDPGEQITGTRDEQYGLISVLYHALQGVETCNAYALDAEAVGDERLAAFFREAGVMQTQLAERAKGILGILEVPPEPGLHPEGPVPSDIALGDPPESVGIQASEVLPPGSEVPPAAAAVPYTALPGGDVEPPLTGAPDDPVTMPPDDEFTLEDSAAVDPQEATEHIAPEDQT